MLVHNIIYNLDKMFLNENMALPFYNVVEMQRRLVLMENNNNRQVCRKAFIDFCEDLHAILKLLVSLDINQNNATKKAVAKLNSGKLITHLKVEKKIKVDGYININKIKKDFAKIYSAESKEATGHIETNRLRTLIMQLEVMMDFLTTYPEEEDFIKYRTYMNNRSGDPAYIERLTNDKVELGKNLNAMIELIHELEQKINTIYDKSNFSVFDQPFFALIRCHGAQFSSSDLALEIQQSKFYKPAIFLIGIDGGSIALEPQLMHEIISELSMLRQYVLPPLSVIDKKYLPAGIINEKERIRNEFNDKFKRQLKLILPISIEKICTLVNPSSRFEIVTLVDQDGKVNKVLDKPSQKKPKQKPIDILVMGRNIQKQDLPKALISQNRYALINDNELFLLLADLIYLLFYLNHCLEGLTQIFSTSPSHLFKVDLDNSKVLLQEQFTITQAMVSKGIQIYDQELIQFKSTKQEPRDDKAEAKDEKLEFYADIINFETLFKIGNQLTKIIKPRMASLADSLANVQESDKETLASLLHELKSIQKEILSTRVGINQYQAQKSLTINNLGNVISNGFEIKTCLLNLRKKYIAIAADYTSLVQDVRWLDRSKKSLHDINDMILAADKTLGECETILENWQQEMDYSKVKHVAITFPQLPEKIKKTESLISQVTESLTVQHTLLQNAELAKQKSLLGSATAFFSAINLSPQEDNSAENALTPRNSI